MKRLPTVLLVALTLLAVTTVSDAQARGGGSDFGLGIALGEPSYLGLKFNQFPIIGLGWSAWRGIGHIHVDGWFINDRIARNWAWFLGLGAKTRLGAGNLPFTVGLRIPVGLQWFLRNNIELFGELVPGIAVFPSFGPWGDAAIGIRFYL